MYFYCHGGKARLAGTDFEIPVLEIGRDDEIAPGDFAAWDEADAWAPRTGVTPLHLSSSTACAAQLMPEDVVSFVEALAGVHAAGVIGTEIAVDQTIAGEVALRFYRQFCGVPTRRWVLHCITRASTSYAKAISAAWSTRRIAPWISFWSSLTCLITQ